MEMQSSPASQAKAMAHQPTQPTANEVMASARSTERGAKARTDTERVHHGLGNCTP
jgi:hypothetical protein